MIKFEPVSKYPDAVLPIRKTAQSAGYDFVVAEDTIVPPLWSLIERTTEAYTADEDNFIPTLDQLENYVKNTSSKLTLVPTGVKCALEPNTYLELSMRSSTPLKYHLILANAIGIIDADYYNNPDNEGAIYFQVINLNDFNVRLRKGDIIGQGIIKKYLTTDDDAATGERIGGFGSTSK